MRYSECQQCISYNTIILHIRLEPVCGIPISSHPSLFLILCSLFKLLFLSLCSFTIELQLSSQKIDYCPINSKRLTSQVVLMDIQTQNSLKHFDTIQDYLLAAIRTLNHRRLDQRETLLGPWHANLLYIFCIYVVNCCFCIDVKAPLYKEFV